MKESRLQNLNGSGPAGASATEPYSASACSAGAMIRHGALGNGLVAILGALKSDFVLLASCAKKTLLTKTLAG